MNLRRPDRKGPEKANYESHMARVREAKTSVDCQAPRPHPLTNKGDMDQVSLDLIIHCHWFELFFKLG